MESCTQHTFVQRVIRLIHGLVTLQRIKYSLLKLPNATLHLAIALLQLTYGACCSRSKQESSTIRLICAARNTLQEKAGCIASYIGI